MIKPNKEHIRPINRPKDGQVINFFIDASGTFKYKEMKELSKQVFSGERPSNHHKAYSISAVPFTKIKLKKARRFLTSLKSSKSFSKSAVLHRNKMKPNRQQGEFKKLDNKELFSFIKSINNFIFKNKIEFMTVGLPNYKNIYINGAKNYVDENKVHTLILTDLLKMVNDHMEKYPAKKAILIFESEQGMDQKTYNTCIKIINNNRFESIRQVRFMKKTNVAGRPNTGIEFVDFLNASSQSFFGLMDFSIHSEYISDFKIHGKIKETVIG